jgi:glycosyltransferase involved in cell wall biosynthesis
MKILHVIHRFVDTDRRGSELYTYHLCRALAQKHEVAVFYTSPKGPKAGLESGCLDGLSTYIIGSSDSWQEAVIRHRSLRAETAFTQVLAEWRPDIVHFQHLLFLSLRLPTIAKRRGLRSVFTLHDFWLLCPQVTLLNHRQRISWPINRLNCYACCQSRVQRAYSWRRLWGWEPTVLMKRALLAYYLLRGRPRRVSRLIRDVDLFIAPSQQLRQRFIHEDLPATKIAYCAYGIDCSIRPPTYISNLSHSGPLECGFIGSVSTHKGIDILLDAFSKIDGARLTVYGRVASQYLERSHSGNVRFMGEIADSEKADAFRQMHVLIVPSIWLENSPIAIHEAFLFGIPVITSNTGGMAELVKDGQSGLHFQLGDAEDLRRKVEYLASNRGELRRLTANVPAVKPIEDNASEIETFYHMVLSGSAPGPSTLPP